MSVPQKSNRASRKIIVIVLLVLILFLMAIYVERSIDLNAVLFEKNNRIQKSTEHLTSAIKNNSNENPFVDNSLSKGNRTSEKNDFNDLRKSASNLDRLPIESILITGGSLDQRNAVAFLDNPNFSKSMDSFEGQMLADPLAIELKNEYENIFRKELEKADLDLSLAELTCGLRLCVGVLRTKSPESFAIWSSYQMGVTASSRIPAFVTVESQIYTYGDMSEQRFLFTTDKENNSVVIRPDNNPVVIGRP